MDTSLSSSKKSKSSRKKVNPPFIRTPQSNLFGKVPFTNQILQRAYDADNRESLMNNMKTARTSQKCQKKNPFESENDPAAQSFKASKRGITSKSMIVRKKDRKKIVLDKSKRSNAHSKITEQANSRSLSARSNDKKNRSFQAPQLKDIQQNHFTNNFTQFGTDVSGYRNQKNTIFFDNFSSRDLKYDYQRLLKQISQKSAFIFTQQKQIEHLLRKTRDFKAENQQLRQQLSRLKEKNFQSISNFSEHSLKNGQQFRILQQGLQQMKQKVDIIAMEKQQLANKYRTSQIQHQILINRFNDVVRQKQHLKDLKVKVKDLELKARDEAQKVQMYLNEKESFEHKIKIMQSEKDMKIKSLEHQLTKAHQELRFSDSKNLQNIKKINKMQQENNQISKKLQFAKYQENEKSCNRSREQQIYQRRLYQSEEVIKSQRERIQLYQNAAVKAQQIIVDLKRQIDQNFAGKRCDMLDQAKQDPMNQFQHVQRIRKIAELKGQVTQLQKQVKYNQKVINDLQKQRNEERESVKNLKFEIQTLQKSIKKIKEQYQQKQLVPAAQLKAIKEEKAQNEKKMIRKIEKLSISQQPLQEQIKSLKEQVKSLQQKNQKNGIINANLQKEVIKSKQQQGRIEKELKTQLESKQSKIKEQQTKIQTLQIRLRREQEDLSSITALSESRQEVSKKVQIHVQAQIMKQNSGPNNQVLPQMKQSPTKNKRKPLEPLFDQNGNEDEQYIDIQTYTRRQYQILSKLKYLDGLFQEQKRKNVKLQTIIDQKQKANFKLQKCIEKLRRQISQLQINTHTIKINAQHQAVDGFNNLNIQFRSKDEQIQKLKQQAHHFIEQIQKLQRINEETANQKDILINQKAKTHKQLIDLKIQVTQLHKTLQKVNYQRNIQILKSSSIFESKLLQNEVNLQKNNLKMQEMYNFINSQTNKINELTVMLKDKQKYLNQIKQHCQMLKQEHSTKEFKLQTLLNQFNCQRRNIQNQINFLHSQVHTLTQQNRTFKLKIEQKQKYLRQCNSKMQSLEKQHVSKIESLQKQHISKIQRLAKEVQSAKTTISEKQNLLADQSKLCNEKRTTQQKIKFNEKKLHQEIEFLKTRISHQEQSKSEYKKDIECKNWQIEILKKQNTNIQEIMKEQLTKRKVIIQQLIIQKRQLYEQLRTKSN